MRTKQPKPDTYRPLIDPEHNIILFQLTDETNAMSLDSNLNPNHLIMKWIEQAWKKAHPELPCPVTKPYHLDIDL